MDPQEKQLINRLEAIVGARNVLSSPSKITPFVTGFRYGKGSALAVVSPGTILEQWKALQVCVDSNCVVIFQAANTGLTGGSVPNGNDYDRRVIVINNLRINNIYLINDNKHVISLSGATLYSLEDKLSKVGRDPHSVIGSSQIGATVVGGIANNSGGALVKRGPAYTESALYAYVDKFGNLKLVNHLGIDGLGDTPEEILTKVQEGRFDKCRIEVNNTVCSDTEYKRWVRDINSNTPARFNADERRLFEASGCAGKVAVFAVRTDTFPKPEQERVFYLGTNDGRKLTELRKHILANVENLPDMAEYMHRTIFKISEDYGKSYFLMVKYLGPKVMRTFFKVKRRLEYLLCGLPFASENTFDKVLFYLSKLFKNHLPQRLIEYRSDYEHHLILCVSDNGIYEIEKYLNEHWSNCSDSGFFCCTKDEGDKALLHRFVAGGAAGNYKSIHSNKLNGIISLDIALRRNDEDWIDEIPDSAKDNILYPLYYGHFLCNVFHRNYLIKKHSNNEKIKSELLAFLDEKGAKYPAEHNVGHEYNADDVLVKFYNSLDPTNTFNPGIGKTIRSKVSCNCC